MLGSPPILTSLLLTLLVAIELLCVSVAVLVPLNPVQPRDRDLYQEAKGGDCVVGTVASGPPLRRVRVYSSRTPLVIYAFGSMPALPMTARCRHASGLRTLPQENGARCRMPASRTAWLLCIAIRGVINRSAVQGLRDVNSDPRREDLTLRLQASNPD